MKFFFNARMASHQNPLFFVTVSTILMTNMVMLFLFKSNNEVETIDKEGLRILIYKTIKEEGLAKISEEEGASDQKKPEESSNKAVPVIKKSQRKAVVDQQSSLPKPAHPNGCFMGRYCFKYIQSPNVCGQDKVTLLTFVFSLPGNAKQRQLIRDTWGNKGLFDKSSLRVVFLLSRSKLSEKMEMTLKAEIELYQDIVVSDFEDHVLNLTLKSLSGFHWATQNCPKASFVMKTDDDMFINMFSLLARFKDMERKKQTQKILMGCVWQGGAVDRTGQYGLSKSVLALDYWPPFCSGSGYIMSVDTAQTLLAYALADKRKIMIHLDDPYITGLLAAQAGITHTKMNVAYILFAPAQKLRQKMHRMTKKRYKQFLHEKIFWHLHDKDFTKGKSRVEEHLYVWRYLKGVYSNTTKKYDEYDFGPIPDVRYGLGLYDYVGTNKYEAYYFHAQ